MIGIIRKNATFYIIYGLFFLTMSYNYNRFHK